MQKLGWFRKLGVTQGHRKHRHLIDCILLRVIARFLPREAMLSAVFAVVVCLCVCVCHTPYCIKTAKRRIMQTTPHDSPMILVF